MQGYISKNVIIKRALQYTAGPFTNRRNKDEGSTHSIPQKQHPFFFGGVSIFGFFIIDLNLVDGLKSEAS